MDLTKTIFETISTRSFSSIWYWIILAVAWSSASHYVMGVPYDMIQRARRHGGEALEDMEDLVRINVNRAIYIIEVSGVFMLGFLGFILTMLATMAVWYRYEFAQAVLLIALPMTLVGLLSLRLAYRLAREEPRAEELFRPLVRHRFWTQVIGMISIFVTAMYGMYRNLVMGFPIF
ncbi:MAG: component of SufBCD complex [Rubellimicrobium sp.]|nr:component of SufBCD complex [Rubellimicrobium sp.]